MRFDALGDSFRTLDTYKFGMQTISIRGTGLSLVLALNPLGLLPV